MRVLIVDDEAPARAKLRRLLSSEPSIEIVGEAATGRQAVAAIKHSAPDLVFLDIQMPGLDGFAVADAVAEDGALQLVFVTADSQSAIRAFEVGAVDYLLKPFTPTRFAQVLGRAHDRAMKQASESRTRPRHAEAPVGFLRRLLVVENGRAVFLAVDQIDRIEAERNYVNVFSNGSSHRLRATIASIAERLDPAHFLRINRSTLIRLDAVKTMHEWSHGDYRVVMADGSELTWSRRFRSAVASEYGLKS